MATARSAEDTDARVTAYSVDSGFDVGTDIDTGIFDIEAQAVGVTTWLEEIRKAARAEGGAVWIQPDWTQDFPTGTLTFRNANWLLQGTAASVQAFFSSSQIPISQLTVNRDTRQYRNGLFYTNSSTTVQAIESYGDIRCERTVLNDNDTDLQAICDRDLDWMIAYARINVIKLRPSEDNYYQTYYGLFLDFGDLVEITNGVGDWDYTVQAHICGIEHTITPDNWEVVYRTDPHIDFDTLAAS